MKLENNQSYITNLQFSGGKPIGSGSSGATTIASGSIALANLIAATGSFTAVNPFGQTYNYFLTASVSASTDAVPYSTGSNQYIAVSGSGTQKVQQIASVLTANADLYLSASVSTTTLVANASFGGVDGNNIRVSGSAFAGGTGVSNWPYSIGFNAMGLYLGQGGNLVATTIDGSVLTFASASGFIPGLFTAVSSASTAQAIIALK
jgi:hypothetical protein